MATIHHTSFAAIRRGATALKRTATTQATLAQLRQVDIALADGDERRARRIMKSIGDDYGLEPGFLPPVPRRDYLLSASVAAATLAGGVLVLMVSCGMGVGA